MAAAHGYNDGEKLSFDQALTNLKEIITSTDLPVTIDLEGGYRSNPNEVQSAVIKVLEAGAVGINFEEQIIKGEELYSIEEQFTRTKAVRETTEYTSILIFINARTDIFLKAAPVDHNNNLLEETIHRAIAYAQSGTNGFFVPGLKDARHIEKLCEVSPIPSPIPHS